MLHVAPPFAAGKAQGGGVIHKSVFHHAVVGGVVHRFGQCQRGFVAGKGAAAHRACVGQGGRIRFTLRALEGQAVDLDILGVGRDGALDHGGVPLHGRAGLRVVEVGRAVIVGGDQLHRGVDGEIALIGAVVQVDGAAGGQAYIRQGGLQFGGGADGRLFHRKVFHHVNGKQRGAGLAVRQGDRGLQLGGGALAQLHLILEGKGFVRGGRGLAEHRHRFRRQRRHLDAGDRARKRLVGIVFGVAVLPRCAKEHLQGARLGAAGHLVILGFVPVGVVLVALGAKVDRIAAGQGIGLGGGDPFQADGGGGQHFFCGLVPDDRVE